MYSIQNKNEIIGWEFPLTDWGSENGKNDPGLETFRGNPYPSITREPIQNSVDEHNGGKNPVKVEFTVFKIKSNLFPGRDEYISVLKQCLKEEKEYSDTYKELKKSLDTILKEEIYFLKISDYFTKGVTGSSELRKTNWHKLIRSVGESDKEETSGGSFGIGKYASFVCSNLKVVFYATLDEEGKSAFQGVAKLISFEDNNGEPHQATGFFGEREKKQPIKSMEDVELYSLNEHFSRTEVGTDLYIAGFDYKDNWANEIKEAAIQSFFPALYNNTLEVIVNGEIINSETLPTLINQMKEDGSKASAIKYYEVLTDEASHCFIEPDFCGLGEVKLYVGNKNNYHKKTAMIRKTGMLIKEKQNYQIPIKYAAVLLINGQAFNKELKRVENPTHTDWEFNRKNDVKVIKKAMKELHEWINKKIQSISPYEDITSFDVDELAEFLPDSNEEMEMDTDSTSTEGEGGTPLEAKIQEVRKKKKKKPLTVTDLDTDEDEPTDEEEPIDEDEPIDEEEPNDEDEPIDEKEPDTKNEPKAQILKYKLFCTNPDIGNYRFKFHSKNKGLLTITLEIIGEDSDMPAEISIASKDGEILPSFGAKIGPFPVEKGSNQIDFELVEKVRVALGVHFNGK